MIKTILIFLILLSFNLKADKNSHKLDLYFEELLEVENISKQNVIVGAIWKEWLKSDNAEIEKIMNIMPYFFQTQNYQEAVNALDYVIELDPMFAEGYNKRATIYFMTGEYEKSMKDIKATLSLEPRHFGALDGMSRILIYFGKYDQALKTYDEMKKLMPNDTSIDIKIDRLNKLIFDDA